MEHFIRKTKVVIVNYGEMIDAVGGVSKVLSELANALSARNYQVSIISLDHKRGKPSFELDDSIIFLPVGKSKPLYYYPPIRDLICWNHSKKIRHQNRGLMLLRWQAKLLSSARRELTLADIIISSHSETTYIIRELLHINSPLITMFHLPPYQYTERPIWDILKNGVEKSDFLQVLLPSYIKELQTRINLRSIVAIPNYVKQINRSPELNSKRIICVARVSQEKCPELLISAFAKLRDQFPDWSVEWYGPKASRPAYINKIKSLIANEKLQNRFFFKGTSLDIPNHLMNSSIFAFPSKFEGFPLALTEAMAHGLPVVGRLDCPAVNELIHNNHDGFLVNNDPDDFARALRKLMISQDLRTMMGRNAKYAMTAYEPNKVWESWEKLIHQVVKAHQTKQSLNDSIAIE